VCIRVNPRPPVCFSPRIYADARGLRSDEEKQTVLGAEADLVPKLLLLRLVPLPSKIRVHPRNPRPRVIRNESMTSTHEYRGYVFAIEYQAQDPAYTVAFADFSNFITSGGSLADAFAQACEALDLHLESLQKLRHPLPPAKHRLVVESAGQELWSPRG
jgi:predicted RNase H-like HicB family nuclease